MVPFHECKYRIRCRKFQGGNYEKALPAVSARRIRMDGQVIFITGAGTYTLVIFAPDDTVVVNVRAALAEG